MKRSTLGRAIVGAILFLTLGGPAPGAVGSCSSESQVVPYVDFCTEQKAVECDRACAHLDPQPPAPMAFCTAAGEADPAACNWMYCRSLVEGACAGADWPSGCDPLPTTAETVPCINALRDGSRLDTPSNALPECSAICNRGGARLTESREGI